MAGTSEPTSDGVLLLARRGMCWSAEMVGSRGVETPPRCDNPRRGDADAACVSPASGAAVGCVRSRAGEEPPRPGRAVARHADHVSARILLPQLTRDPRALGVKAAGC